MLRDARLLFPPFGPVAAGAKASKGSLQGCAVLLTAGGEGERLRESLRRDGYPPERLDGITKPTFPLGGSFGELGSLHVNLCLIASLCGETGVDIPVIISTGPEGSITDRVVPRVPDEYPGCRPKHLRIVAQEARLHLSKDEKIVWILRDGEPEPVVNPDETGGPLSALARGGPGGEPPVLSWLKDLGCRRLLVLQATAIYDPRLLPAMASFSPASDCVGVGILRREFPPDDPFGTYVVVAREGEPSRLVILEQEARDDRVRALRESHDGWYLPFNTGFYALDPDVLDSHVLPDYATPPKVVAPGLPRSPKIGYAATDIVTFARSPAVLAADPKLYAVIKNAEDIKRLARRGEEMGLDRMCRTVLAR